LSQQSQKPAKPAPRRVLHPIAYGTDDFVFGTDQGYDVIRLRGGGLTDRVGWPALPFALKQIVLPAGAKNVKASLKGEKWVRMRGKYTLVPVQPPRPGKRDERTLNTSPLRGEQRYNQPFRPMDPEVSKLRELPLTGSAVASVSSVAGYTVAGVRVYPLRYDPATHAVSYLAAATLRVEYTGGRSGTALRMKSPQAAGIALKKLLALADNPEDIRVELPSAKTFDRIRPISPDDPQLKWPTRDGHASDTYPIERAGKLWIPPDIILEPLFEDWPYVIVTDDSAWSENGVKGGHLGDLIAEFEALARWKTMKGIRARVVSISDIMANRFGAHWQPGVTRDTQEAVRNFLKFAYQYWNTRWCLLGGDVNVVPARHVLGNINWFYASRDGNPTPDAGAMYFDAAAPALRYQSPYDFRPDDVFVAVDTAQVVRYRADADPTHPGWHWTQADYTTPSVTPTRFIVIRGGAALLAKTFTVPQYINMIPTDLYYASVDSPLYSLPGRHDWDNDGNGLYGWWDGGNPDGIDFAADISVGRAPVRTTAHAHTFVEKVLTYERYRDVRTDKPLAFDYTRKLYCVGSVWGSNWWDGSFDRIRWGGLDGACQDKENVIALFRTMGMTTDLVTRFYEDIYFMPHIESNLATLDVAHLPAMRNAVNDGPHFLSVTGHGWWDGTAGFSSTNPYWVNVEGMTNWPHLSIYFVDSCLTNEFDADLWTDYDRTGGRQVDPNAVCLGKHLVRWNNGGAIGYVGCSRECIVGATQEVHFWEALSLPGQAHLGKLLDHAREIGIGAVGAYQTYLQNLMGDPELPVFTETPRVFTVAHTSFIYGKDRLTVSVFHEEAPVTNATVTVCQLSDTDPLYKRHFRLVDAVEGSYTFDTSGAQDGKVYIVVTARNAEPYVASAEKVSSPVSQYKFRTRGFVYDVVRKGTGVYAASGDARLYGLSATLDALWLKTLNGPVQDLDAGIDQQVLVGLRKTVANNLLLFDGAGTQLQAWSLPNEVYSVARDPGRSAAFAGMRDNGVRAYNTATGTARWQRADLTTALYVAVGPGGNLYATSAVGGSTVLKLAPADGSTVWSYTVGSDWTFSARDLLVAADGGALVSTANHELHRIDAAGTQVWKKTALSSVVVSMAQAGTRVYAGLGDGELMAIDHDGTVAWSRDLGDRVEAIVVRGGVLYAGCWHGVYALDVDGNPLWFRETTGAVLSLTVAGNRLFCGSRDGYVYSVELPSLIPRWPPGDFDIHDAIVRIKGYDMAAGRTHVLATNELVDLLHIAPRPGPLPRAGARTRSRGRSDPS
jgi:hypothetical protein